MLEIKTLPAWFRTAGLLLTLLMPLTCTDFANAAPTTVRHRAKKQPHHKLHKAGWAGAGLAAGQAVGPAGSAAVGATKYRKDLKAGGKRRSHAIAKVGVPIAAGAIAGPGGNVGY